ncbi:MAG: light-harvesting protein [Pseudomonadota bacterium]
MNNSKIWLVVNPTVGVPLFLGAVAVGSFAVHVAVMQNTTWIDDFLSGKELGAGMAAVEVEETTSTASYVSEDGTKILVTMPDGTTAHAVLTPEQSATLIQK